MSAMAGPEQTYPKRRLTCNLWNDFKELKVKFEIDFDGLGSAKRD